MEPCFKAHRSPRVEVVGKVIRELAEGIVVRSFSKTNLVLPADRDWTGLLLCETRGRLRLGRNRIYTGDRVLFRPGDGGRGRIEEVRPRTTILFRPPVANVEQAVLVFAAAEPDPSRLLLDRLLLVAAVAGIRPVICLNKMDLGAEDFSLYRDLGYPVLTASARTGEGLSQLAQRLRGKVSILIGPSGVGKSSLLNALDHDRRLPTGEVSSKLGRGRHTTRWVEILPVGDGLVADSPGFTSLELHDIPSGELAGFFPEMAALVGSCRYAGCLHRREPGCAVRASVGETVDRLRYDHYLFFFAECVKEDNPWSK